VRAKSGGTIGNTGPDRAMYLKPIANGQMNKDQVFFDNKAFAGTLGPLTRRSSRVVVWK